MMTSSLRLLVPVCFFAAFAAVPAIAGSAAETALLPPALPWDGASRALIAAADDPWITPAEASGFVTTPSYDETIAWLERLTAASPALEMVSFGKSGEGRDLWLVIASADRAFTPAALSASAKPILLAQAGIHAGEIDGKDAGLMLLRDLTVGGSQRALLDKAHLLFVPIFNTDGHERSSPYGRINQRGPRAMGWRTTARNLNLNRDYAKLDTPEMQAMVRLLDRFAPDLYVDLHVTDGVDYQYDITWGFNGRHAYSPAIAGWLETHLSPALHRDLEAMGHIPGPLVFALNPQNVSEGIWGWTGGPRYSDGYGGARHLATVLVENHSLKPYEQRVLGTYVLLTSMLRSLGEHGESLRHAVATDEARRPASLPLTWKAPDTPPPVVSFLGIEGRIEPSSISGGQKVVWTGKPVTLEIPNPAGTEPGLTATRPVAYWIPPVWDEVITRLALHGIQLERLDRETTHELEMYRVEDAKLGEAPFEGHARVTATPVAERLRVTFPAGSVRIPTDQPRGDLAMLLLEPASPDSFFQWGFFLEILSRTEYVEGYVMEPMGERMLAEDPALKAAYEAALEADSALAADPRARLQWLYRHTPFFDARWRLYPVGRELASEGD